MISSLGHRLIFLACNSLIAFSTNVGAVLGPELSVRTARGKTAKLAIEEIKANISFLADIAETNLTITFRNTEERMLEGEFAIPLPEGATVSSYALDVNGAMRDAAVVEKERARFAYESIKRQMIDPGYVEREAGNIYRTKIFPILSKSTKAVRIGYREHLPPIRGQLSYRLPLALSRSAEKTSFTVAQQDDERITIQNSAGLTFKKLSSKLWAADSTKHFFDQDLILTFSPPKSPRLLTSDDFFYLYHPHPPLPEVDRSTSSRIHLMWDSSYSGNFRDHAKEFDFLNHYFKKLGNTVVELSLLHFMHEESGTYQVQNGEWDSLRKKLEGIHYNGATNLSILRTKQIPTILFTDGKSHFSPDSVTWPERVTLIDSLGTCSAVWKHHAYRHLDLRVSTIPEAYALMMRPLPELKDLSGIKASQLMTTFPSSHDPSLRIFGEVKPPIIASAILNFRGISDPDRLVAETAPQPESTALINTVWAQRKLEALEAQMAPQEEIISHCKSYGLVSDHTSLIVLDRFKDYLRYQIPPPEKDLRKRYETELAKKPGNQFHRFDNALRTRGHWHKKIFPWHDYQLLGRLGRVYQWQSALKEIFKPSEISRISHEAIREWKHTTSEVITKRELLKTQSQFESWHREVQKLSKNNFFIDPPSENTDQTTPITVSVRGLVKTEGKIIGAKDLTLKQALSGAGGFLFENQVHAIALYRNATKTLYNIYSKEFIDVSLLAGDMLVAEPITQLEYDDSDPFSDNSSPPRDPREQPAIIPQNRKYLYSDSDPFADDSGDWKPSKAERTRELIVRDLPFDEQIQQFEQSLIDGHAPHLAYAELTQNRRFTASFYYQISEILRRHSQPELAKRVLSNLIETETADITSYRNFAFILVHQQDWQTALAVLQSIARAYPKERALKLDLAWILGRLDSAPAETRKKIEDHWLTVAMNGQARSKTPLIEIAGANLRASPTARKRLPFTAQDPPHDLGLRVIIACASTDFHDLKITEPPGTIPPSNHWARTSPCGGRYIQELGIAEYAIKDAIPGIYDFSCVTQKDRVFRVQIYRNWGRPNQSSVERIVTLSDNKDSQTILRCEVKLPEK